jgi:dihydroorotate dehydrogenase
MYRSLVRPLLFSFPPEWIHHASLAAMTRTPAAALIEPFARHDFPSLKKNLFGLTFPNPIGLAAGFDKNAEGVTVWPRLGFGFMELGTVTPRPQPGNPTPRVFRLPAEQGLINRLGFPNVGVEEVAHRLEKIKNAGRWPKTPVGLNLGKNKDTPLTDAGRDYVTCFRRLRGLADYFVVNVSSPNTPGLRELQQGQLLDSILAPLRDEDPDAKLPLLLKIAPDLEEKDLVNIVSAVEKYRLVGIVATNTTIDKRGLSVQEEGGASGRPVTRRSTEIIRAVHRLTNGQVPIIGVGGIFNADDAREKLEAGASLLQIYTGFVYEGPLIMRRICEGLVHAT